MAAPLLGRTLGGLREPWSDRSQGSLLLAPQVMRRLAGNAALFFACDEEMKSPRGRLSREATEAKWGRCGAFASALSRTPHAVPCNESNEHRIVLRWGAIVWGEAVSGVQVQTVHPRQPQAAKRSSDCPLSVELCSQRGNGDARSTCGALSLVSSSHLYTFPGGAVEHFMRGMDNLT